MLSFHPSWKKINTAVIRNTIERMFKKIVAVFNTSFDNNSNTVTIRTIGESNIFNINFMSFIVLFLLTHIFYLFKLIYTRMSTELYHFFENISQYGNNFVLLIFNFLYFIVINVACGINSFCNLIDIIAISFQQRV